MSFVDLLGNINAIFLKLQIPYAVIGGYAVAAWGEERATRDIVLLCLSDSREIIKVLREDHLQFEHRIGDSDGPISEVIRIDAEDLKDPFEVDILIGIKNAPVGILSRIRKLNIEGLAIPVASPEDMILLKLLAGSARDLEDAKSIIQIQGSKLDFDLLRRICPVSYKDTLEKLL
jgi:predicted nucleotidyltransferase